MTHSWNEYIFNLYIFLLISSFRSEASHFCPMLCSHVAVVTLYALDFNNSGFGISAGSESYLVSAISYFMYIEQLLEGFHEFKVFSRRAPDIYRCAKLFKTIWSELLRRKKNCKWSNQAGKIVLKTGQFSVSLCLVFNEVHAILLVTFLIQCLTTSYWPFDPARGEGSTEGVLPYIPAI